MRTLIILLLSLFCIESVAFSADVSNQKHRVKNSKITLHKKAVHHKKKKCDVVIKKNVHNYPPPGGGGEERNTDFYRKRAFPSEFIDPAMYEQALDEARRMPVWHGASGQTQQSDMAWKSVGPFGIGGRVTAIVTHPTDSNLFYVGAAAGGLWKTTDHGNSWTALTDTFAMLPIGCITLDPSDANTIYIGMGECNSSGDSYPGNGLWRSTNAGMSWTYLGLGKTQYISKIILGETNIIYACVPGPNNASDSNRGIWKSIDYGATWTRSLLVRSGTFKTSTPVPAIDLVMNPVDHNDLVVAMWQHIDFNVTTSPYTGLWRTHDAGATWSRIDTIPNSGYPNGFKLKRLARTSLLWTTNGKGVPMLYSVVAKVDTNPITHYNLDENFYGLFATANPETIPWQIKLDSSYRIPFNGNNVISVDFFNKQGGYNNFIIGRPGSDATGKDIELLVGGIDVIRSTDAGTTWTNITKAYPRYFNNDRSQHSDQHALAFTAAKSGNDLLNGQDGGVFNTKDYGASWTRVEGLPITMFYHLEPWEAGMTALGNNFPADSIKLIGGTQDNGTVAHGFSANPDWDWINRGDGGQAQTDPNNKNHIITSLQLGKVFFRNTLDSLRPNLFTDNGNLDPNAKKWFDILTIMKRRGITDSSESCAFIPPVVLDKLRANELYTGRTKVYRAKLDFADPDSGTVIQSWSPQIAGAAGNPKAWYNGTIDCIALGARDRNGRPMLWAGGLLSGGTSLWRTVYNPTIPQDSAPRWIKVVSGLPAAYVAAIVCDRSDSMTAFCGLTGTGSTKHLYKTVNGGKNWISISGNLPNSSISAIVIDSLAEQHDPLLKNQCIIVATDVGVFVTTDGGKSWSQLGTGMPHLVVETITMYKNWLIAGTHGRSAWALDVSSLKATPPSAVHDVAKNNFSLAIESVYPNPVTTGGQKKTMTLSLRSNTRGSQKIGIDVFHITSGAVVIHRDIELTGSAEQVPLELPESLASGTYMIRVSDSFGGHDEKQLIIVR